METGQSTEIEQAATSVPDELIDAVIFRLRRTSMPYRKISEKMAEGVPMHGQLVQLQMGKSQIRNRWKAMIREEMPEWEVEEARAEVLLALGEAQQVAFATMLSTSVSPADRMSAVRASVTVLRAKSDLLGLAAPKVVDVNVTEVPLEVLRERAMQVLAERLDVVDVDGEEQ